MKLRSGKIKKNCSCHHRRKKAECCHNELGTPFEDDGDDDDDIDPQIRSMHPTHSSPPDRPSQHQIVRDISERIGSKGYGNDPNNIPYRQPSDWATWDGTTTYDPCTLTKQQLVAAIFPKFGIMRGLKELFYSINPFQDNFNPTPQEIENWNIEVIRHFRRLLGITTPVVNDKATFLKAAWAEERARSNYWDTSYPGNLNSNYGPCTRPFSPNAHCGASFIPSPQDQAPYLDPDMQPITTSGGAEGIATLNADIPWALKMSQIISTFLSQDGIGGHTGPFLGRPKYGSAWYLTGTSVVVRNKWTGTNIDPCPP
nr:hypothetical protein [Cressdnaviricota sp.]